jgi:hypothetical protein
VNPQESSSDSASDTSEPGQLIESQFRIIDKALAQENWPIPLRPLIAASIFAEKCVLVNGERCDDYIRQPWFSNIISESEHWFSRKYGDALNDTSFMAQSASAIIMIVGSPFRLCIPLMVSTDVHAGNSFRAHFPFQILPSEDPLAFIVSPPNLHQLPEVDGTSLSSEIEGIAGAHRSLRRALSFCEGKSDPQIKDLAQTIPTHLNNAVDGLLAAQRDNAVTLPYWEMHLAAEKLLKLILRQQGAQPPKHHELDVLCKKAAIISGRAPRLDLLAKIAWYKNSIQMRYGEGTPKTVANGVCDFNNLIEFLVDAAASLRTSLVVPGKDLVLELQLPWAK